WQSVLAYGATVTPGRAPTTGAEWAAPDPGGRRLLGNRASGRPARSFDHYTFFTVFQPIVDLHTRAAVGYEALTRFADGRSFEEQLNDASSEGVDVDLDTTLALSALEAARELPDDVFVSVNVSA